MRTSICAAAHRRARGAPAGGRAQLERIRIRDLGAADLGRLAHHYHALLEVITEKLHARHCDISEELIAPRVRDLEDELAAAKTRALDLGEQLYELDKEHRRLLASLVEAARSVQEVQKLF